jgi:hypothetical protein
MKIYEFLLNIFEKILSSDFGTSDYSNISVLSNPLKECLFL